jgi:hypothetical protein
VGSVPGGNGSLITIWPSRAGWPSSSTTRTSYPGIGTVAEPGRGLCGSRPIGLAATGQPVSVCHQWSTTGMPSRSRAQA